MSSTLEMNSLVGFVIYKKTTKELEDSGYLCPTKCYFVQQNDAPDTDLNYNDEYNMFIVNNSTRNKIIQEIADKYSENKKILILTRRIEHAAILGRMIKNSVVITGETCSDARKQLFDDFKNYNNTVLIGSVKIFSSGVDIPSLDIILNASGHKSSIDSVQIVGRVKRTSPGKKFGYFIDFNDNTKYLRKASKERQKILKRFGNEVSIIYSKEDMEIT